MLRRLGPPRSRLRDRPWIAAASSGPSRALCGVVMIHVASRDSSGGSNQQSFIDVKFYACTSDAAVVAAIHRSIARLEQHYPIGRAAIAIHGGRRKTSIDLAVTLSDGQLVVATTS